MTAARSCGAAWPISPLVVPSDYIPRIQEVQASVYHVIRENLELIGHAQA